MIRPFAIALFIVALAGAHAGAEKPVTLAPVLSAADWLGSAPTAQSLRGKVVLVDVFTFGCYNCQNVVPNLRALHRTPSSDLAIVGIHSPETPYERDRAHVIANLRQQGITWPVVLDNDFRLWHAYGVEYWPTQLIFDRKGILRKTIVGDSQDEDVERTVRALIAER